MSFQHGKSTVITVGGTDISAYTNTSTFTRGAKLHETSAYGVDDETHSGGLKNGKFSLGGTYDNGSSNTPRTVFEGSLGSTLSMVRRPEGTGTGKPNQAFSAVLESYVETNPVSDMIAWTAEMTVTGAVTRTTQ